MIITINKEIKIQYDEELKLMRAEWVGGADMRRFRTVLEQLQKLTKQLQVSVSVLDLGDLPDISAYDQIWLGTHLLPKMRSLNLQQISLVIPSSQVYNQQSIELLLQTARPALCQDVQFFRTAAMAMSWLLDRVPRLPELLAEWEEADPIPQAAAPSMVKPSSSHRPR